MYSLCIIDMQNYFYAAKNKQLISNIKNEIIKTKQLNYPVIYVKYELSPWTSNQWEKSLCPGLSNITRFYKQKYTVVKKYDNGAKEVYNFLKNNNLPLNLKVCGVNGNVCVYYTVNTLSKLYNVNIEILEDCIASESDYENLTAMIDFSNMKNVKVIAQT